MRLIDADALEYRLGVDEDDKPLWFLYADDIKHMPTIDPVKHGHWSNAGMNHDYFWLMQCSVCRGLASQVADYFVYDYCPYCGAKMDEEG